MTNLKIGTETNYGNIYAVKEVNKIQYYFMQNKNKVIIMMPASSLEKEFDK